MSNLSVIRVPNSNANDCEEMTLCTEFLDSMIRILILRHNLPPVLGEVKATELWDIAKDTFPESEANFFQEARNVFTGKETDFDFSLEDETFEWRKGIWTRGFIKVLPVSEIIMFSDLIQNFLLNLGSAKGNNAKIVAENEELKNNLEVLKERLEEMISIKESMETKLYAQFRLLLSTKKRKIRELQDEIKTIQRKNEKSVYDESTDTEKSDEEGERTPDLKLKEKIKKTDEIIKKPELKETNGIRLRAKNEVWSDANQINQESATVTAKSWSPEPSTSKQSEKIMNESIISTPLNVSRKSPLENRFEVGEYEFDDIIDGVINVQPPANKRDAEFSSEISSSAAKIPRKAFDFTESDDEDFELKHDEDSFEKANNNLTHLNITDEAPEPDLFSESF